MWCSFVQSYFCKTVTKQTRERLEKIFKKYFHQEEMRTKTTHGPTQKSTILFPEDTFVCYLKGRKERQTDCQTQSHSLEAQQQPDRAQDPTQISNLVAGAQPLGLPPSTFPSA